MILRVVLLLLTVSQGIRGGGQREPSDQASENILRLVRRGERGEQIVLFDGCVGASYAHCIDKHLLKSPRDAVGLKLAWFIKHPHDAQGIFMLLRPTFPNNVVDIDIN